MHPVILAEDTFTGLAAVEIVAFRDLLTGLEGVGVEIGCLDGFSTSHILQCSALRLTSIDPFISDSMAPNLIGDRGRLTNNVKPWKDRHTLVEGYSWDVAKTWNLPLDLLFIDGDHNYEAVCRDYDDWVPFLKPGAILAVHDSRQGRLAGAPWWPGPTRMATERIYDQPERWEVVREAFSLTVARKIFGR